MRDPVREFSLGFGCLPRSSLGQNTLKFNRNNGGKEMAQEIKITAGALSDMRDVLEEVPFNYVNAQYAKEKAVLKAIKRHFGSVENWLRQYGYLN